MKPWWLASVLVALVLPGGPALARDTAVREQSRFERDAAGLASVSVSNARGLVDIRPSADGRVRVVALKVVHAMSSSLSRELAEKTVVDIDQARTELQIRVRYPTHRVRLTFWGDLSGNRIPRVEVRLAIEAPAHLAVSITSASGDVVSQGRTGSQILHTASGDVEVASAAGLCEVVTASGDVSLSDVATTSVKTASGEVQCGNVRGALDVSTASGEVTIATAADSVRISTTSGDVRCDRVARGLDVTTASGQIRVGSVSGPVRVRGVSGDVDVGLAGPVGPSDLRTQSGTLTVRLSERAACTIDASSASGEVDFRLPIQTRTLSRGRFVATLRGGATTVHLRSVLGDINVMGGGR